LTYLGEQGYVDIMRDLMATTEKVQAAITSMAGVDIVGDPIGPVFALKSDTIDLYAVADVMDDKGWNLNRNTDPQGLHLMLSPAHGAVADELIADLRDAVADHGASRGPEARSSCAS
jgi:sphinganine-1-phosphate aldolase